MKRRTSSSLLVTVLSAVVLSACGSSSHELPGAYVTTINAPRDLTNGSWTLTLRNDGSFTVKERRGLNVSTGKGSFWRGDRLVVTTPNPRACGPGQGIGTYKLKRTGATLAVIRIADPCKLRTTVLNRTYTRVH
jgi:hypothetical protein